jgi:hypothetical protein
LSYEIKNLNTKEVKKKDSVFPIAYMRSMYAQTALYQAVLVPFQFLARV